VSLHYNKKMKCELDINWTKFGTQDYYSIT